MNTAPIISNNWKYKISIKDQFTDHTTPEVLITLCTSLVFQLKRILKSIEKSNMVEEERFHMYGELELISDNFECLKKEMEDSGDNALSMVQEYEEEFNGYMSMLFDLGDQRVLVKGNVSEKFMWIG